MMSLQEKIQKQEEKDRYVATKCLEELFTGWNNLTINTTDISSYVDLKCSVMSSTCELIPFNVEIKERFKNEENLRKYPNAELKVAKYERMASITPPGTSLFYMVLLNDERCLIFNLTTLDWSKVSKINWRIKIKQVDPRSPFVSTPVYTIPYDLAVATIDCSPYVKQYAIK